MASIRLARASSIVSPWLAMPNRGHSLEYISSMTPSSSRRSWCISIGSWQVSLSSCNLLILCVNPLKLCESYGSESYHDTLSINQGIADIYRSWVNELLCKFSSDVSVGYADSKSNIDDTISPSHTRGAAAKSVAGIGTPHKSQGDQAPAYEYERFFSVRSSACYGLPDRPRKGAASLCAVVPTCPVDRPLIGTRVRSKTKAQGPITMDIKATGASAPDPIDSIDRIQTLITESQVACDLIEHARIHNPELSQNALSLLLEAISSRLGSIHAETQMMASGLPHNASDINGGAV